MDIDTIFSDKNFKEKYNRLWKYCRYLLNNEEDAYDMSQEVMITAYNYFQYNELKLERFEGWLIRVAMNRFLNKCRQKRRQEKHIKIKYTNKIEQENSANEQDDPSVICILREDEEIIREAMKSLSERERDCLRCYLNEQGYSDIAEVLGIKIGTVKSLICRTKKQLRIFFLKREEVDL